MAIKKENVNEEGTIKVYQTPRLEGTLLQFTSVGDDRANNVIGEGPSFAVDMGTDNIKTVEFGFTDTVYIKDGYCFWENAQLGDNLNMEVFIPAGVPLDIIPLEMNAGNCDENGNLTAGGAMHEDSTHFITPEPITVNRFINKISILGSNYTGLVLESQDAMPIPSELMFRVKVNRGSGNTTELKVSFIIELYRKDTVTMGY